MENTSTISNADLVFYRRLRRNLVFSEVLAHFASLAAREGLTKRELGNRIGKDAASITRWFSEPSNLSLDTVSDLLTGMGAEMVFRVVDASEQHEAEGLMKEFTDWFSKPSQNTEPPKPVATMQSASVLWSRLPRTDRAYGEQQATS